MKLETNNLVVGYPDGPHKHCPDFAVGRGDFICITGANGAGKTALLKTLAGLIPPISGEIIFSQDATNNAPGTKHEARGTKHEARSTNLTYLPQQGPMQKDFPASVLEVVRSGCQSMRGLRPFYTFSERRRAERIMERLGISELRSRSYRELSGGQRQRVLIARTFAVPHDIILLDEPTNALDKDAIDDFMRLLSDVNSKGAAIVMVTHDTSLLSLVPDTKVKMLKL